MKKLSFLLFLASFVIKNQDVNAQFQGAVYANFQDPQVLNNGIPLNSPWCGGINSVQINHADLNNDGIKDLILFDHNNNLIKTFLNTGSAGQIKYVYSPKYANNFPVVHDYLIMKDYNCDNIPDLFHKGDYGVGVYKGYYQANELKFTYYKELFFQGVNGPVNVYVQPGDIPSVIDYDKDGDLDILSFDVLGAKMTYYKNVRVEQSLPCDSIRMTEFDQCWGKFFQGFNRAVVTGITCKGGAAQNKKNRHTGNCVVHLDIEGDGDYDLLGGNISYSDAQLLFNNGSDIINAQDTLYNKLGHQLQMPFWPSPFHVDIDNDGDKDILFTSHTDNLSAANFNAVAYYKNTGTDALPNFVFQHDTLLTPDMIDVGSYSYPTFFDYDKDGKKDLFVGTEGYLDNVTGLLSSKIAYYKNTSVSGAISFDLQTKDFLTISSHNYNGIFPTFGDVTGDGVDDLVMGNVDGYVSVFKNFAASNTVTPNFIFFTDSIAGVSVTKYSTPFVYDINQDGRSDLIVGNQLGKIAYFEDTSSSSIKKLALKTVSLGNIKAGSVNQLFGYSAPTIAKMDNANKEFLVIGNVDGTIERYDSFKNNWGVFPRLDSNYSFIQTSNRSVPAIADIDGDGNYDMVIGNKMGGLNYYKQVLNVAIGVQDYAKQGFEVMFYPNPTKDMLRIDYNTQIGSRQAIIRIQDITGRVVKEFKFDTALQHTFDIASIQAGIYVVVFESGSVRQAEKLIVE